jgi:moderate conductance mechanosensitive channel
VGIGLDTVGAWLRNGLLPAVVLTLGAALVARSVHWIAERYRDDIDDRIRLVVEGGDVASEAVKRSRAVVQAVEWVIVSLIYVVSGILVVHLLGIPLATLVAPATIVGVALGFGAQQVVADLLAGFFLFAERQFGFGDVIRFSQPGQTTGVTGTVEELTLRVTKLRTAQGELVIVPNSALRQVTNLSKEWSRAVLDIPVALGEDLERASRVLREAAQAMAKEEPWRNLLLSEPVVAGVETFEVGYVRLRLVARTLPGRQFEVARELRLRCANALTEAGIASPAVDPNPSENSP